MELPGIDYTSATLATQPQATRELWQQRIASVNLPPLLTDVLAAGMNVDSFDTHELSVMASHDPVLTAKLLAVANSAKFGLRSPMTSIQRAIIHLGFNLVKTIMVAYQLEATFGQLAHIPKEFLSTIRRWSSSTSIIAFHWGQLADLTDVSTAATAALISRLGTLLLGLADPPPGAEYWAQPDEPARLAYELEQWQVTSPMLGAELSRRWGLPDPLPELVEGQGAPYWTELPASFMNHAQCLIAGSVALAARYQLNPSISINEVFDLPAHFRLKANLANNRLLDCLPELWQSLRLQRELALACEE